MDLAEGDTLLVLVEEHADEAQGWIFAAKAAEAGYVPRTYLELAADDAPAKAPTPEVTDSERRRGDPGARHAAARRVAAASSCAPLSPIAGSPPETAQSPQPQGALEDYLWAIFQRVDTEREGTVATAEVVQALRDDGGFAGALGFTGPVRGARTTRRSSATTSRARSRRWTPTACPGTSSGGARRSATRTARATASGSSPTRTRSSSGASRARAATASAASSGAPWRAATTTTRTRRGRRGRTRRGPATRCTTSSRTSSRPAGLRRAV